MVILLPLDKKGILKTCYLFIFRETGMEGKRGGETSMCVCLLRPLHPTTGNLVRKPDICPDWESNQQSFGSQATIQSTEPY